MKMKKFWKKQECTFMLVQNSGHSVRQLQLNFVVLYILLAIVLLILSALVINNYQLRNSLADKEILSAELLRERDRTNSLQAVNESYEMKVNELKGALVQNTEITQSRLENIEKTEEKLCELVTIFNEQTNSDIVFSRSSDYRDSLADVNSVVCSITELESDEIMKELQAHQEELDTLKNDLTAQLDYLEARPDFFPTTGTLTSPYGYRTEPYPSFHNGIDVAAPVGTPVYAAGAGTVISAGFKQGYGYIVLIDHGYGYTTAYAHLSTILVEAGQVVEKGGLIAEMGSTGNSTGPHLHFEIRYEGATFDPITMVNY